MKSWKQTQITKHYKKTKMNNGNMNKWKNENTKMEQWEK